MAAATVSGVAALIRARNPAWTQYQVFQQLVATAEDVHTPGWDAQTGWGLVRAPLAVAFAPPREPRLTWSTVPFAIDYVVYSKITPTICPVFQQIGSPTATSYTDQSIQVTSYTAVSYEVYARSNGISSLPGRTATYKTTLTSPPC